MDEAVPAERATRIDPRSSAAIQRRRIVIIVTLIGLITTAIGVWLAHLSVYLIGLGLTACALIALTTASTNRNNHRKRVVAITGVLGLVAAAVVLPAAASKYTSPSEAEWEWSGDGQVAVETALEVNNRILVPDDAGLHALDPRTGEEDWSYATDLHYFLTSADGHVLTMGRDSSAWLDPQGKVLWTQQDLERSGQLQGASPTPVAAAGDMLVFRDCQHPSTDDGTDADVHCDYRGFGTDGEAAYEVTGEGASRSITHRSGDVVPENWGGSKVLPSIFLAPEQIGQHEVRIVQADSGEVTATIDADGPAYVDDTIVVHQIDNVLPGTCDTQATRPDGSELWQAQTECFNAATLGTFVDDWIYLPFDSEDRHGGEAGTIALDTTTGESHEFGSSQEWSGRFSLRTPPDTLGPGTVIEPDEDSVAGLDPGSGEELWRIATSSDPSVNLANGGLVLSDEASEHNPFGAQGDRIYSIINPRTGEQISSLRVPRGAAAKPLGPQRVLVARKDSLMFVADE